MTRRRAAAVLAVLAFLVVSAGVARWLHADSVERAAIERLLRAQARGDAEAMAGELHRCDPACREGLGRLASALRGPGDLDIVRFDSDTAHALGPATGPARVVWRRSGPGGTLPTVQCVTVQRTRNAVAGPHVRLLRLSAPIGREDGC